MSEIIDDCCESGWTLPPSPIESDLPPSPRLPETSRQIPLATELINSKASVQRVISDRSADRNIQRQFFRPDAPQIFPSENSFNIEKGWTLPPSPIESDLPPSSRLPETSRQTPLASAPKVGQNPLTTNPSESSFSDRPSKPPKSIRPSIRQMKKRLSVFVQTRPDSSCQNSINENSSKSLTNLSNEQQGQMEWDLEKGWSSAPPKPNQEQDIKISNTDFQKEAIDAVKSLTNETQVATQSLYAFQIEPLKPFDISHDSKNNDSLDYSYNEEIKSSSLQTPYPQRITHKSSVQGNIGAEDRLFPESKSPEQSTLPKQKTFLDNFHDIITDNASNMRNKAMDIREQSQKSDQEQTHLAKSDRDLSGQTQTISHFNHVLSENDFIEDESDEEDATPTTSDTLTKRDPKSLLNMAPCKRPNCHTKKVEPFKMVSSIPPMQIEDEDIQYIESVQPCTLSEPIVPSDAEAESEDTLVSAPNNHTKGVVASCTDLKQVPISDTDIESNSKNEEKSDPFSANLDCIIPMDIDTHDIEAPDFTNDYLYDRSNMPSIRSNIAVPKETLNLPEIRHDIRRNILIRNEKPVENFYTDSLSKLFRLVKRYFYFH